MLNKLNQWFFKQFSLSSDFDVAAITDIGNRTVNQDYYQCKMLDQYLLLVIADGLGGHKAGELAAKGLCEGIVKLGAQYEPQLAESPTEVLSQWIKDAALHMNDYIKRQTTHTNAHTTLALVLLSKTEGYVAHIGDTRIYKLSNEKVLFQSRDDSLVQLLIEAGEVAPSDSSKHPLQNKLLKSVSYGKSPEPQIEKISPLEENEGVLVCSDGLWDNIDEGAFLALVESANLDKTLTAMALQAKEKGGKNCDNITAIFARPRC